MRPKRTSHAIYDTKYHLVWAPKYRKLILRGDLKDRVESIFEEISRNHDFEIDTMEIAEEHVHIFLSFPPRYSISRVVGMLKSISASIIFREHPEVKRELWGGEFWEDGYFVRTVGDKVTADVIRNYIKYHQEQEKTPEQLELF
ncbi:MAG: IS200/IS605 family transposase [Candidatus Glassbacteria bacterium]|nr:IS200/IS605 family transposase [Candidatus Glassbacteria bacterium]